MQTLNDIAREFDVSLQTVYNWKTAAERDLGHKIAGQPHPVDQRKVIYSPADVALIVGDRAVPQHQPEELPEAPPATYRAGGLVPVATQPCTRTIALFDAEQYQTDKQALDDAARHQAASLNEMVAAYAQARIASVLADVDLVADSLRANALQAMGAAPGKPSTSPQDGQPV